ncbi:D-inositol 3-phosphate glycosyltransferase [Halioglobus japonicus]|nr:D-inositol 3-phosphate glycosyltransferase [Halioglobus japonicus]
MKLILNAKALRPPITGVGNYTYHLLEQYLQGSDIDEVHCFSGSHWLTGEEQRALTIGIRTRREKDARSRFDGAFSQLRDTVSKIPGTQALFTSVMDKRFEHTANRIPDAVYHETNYVLRPYAGPCVTTVHDLSHIRYPHYHADHLIEWLNANLQQSLNRADCVLTVSNIVRDELIEHFNLAEDKVRTIYEGVESCYMPRTEEQTAAVLSSLGLRHKHYVLLSATLEPRKGIDVLLDAWSLLPASVRREFPLVLTGSSGWRNESLMKKLAGLVAEGTVHHLGYVPLDELSILFSGAAVFCYPSVYEGFGLPVLDAMSSGTPVICRAGTSMEEFAQGACMLCETGEPEELASKLDTLLHSSSARSEWAEKGLRQASLFSWERCAAETAEVYRAIS